MMMYGELFIVNNRQYGTVHIPIYIRDKMFRLFNEVIADHGKLPPGRYVILENKITFSVEWTERWGARSIVYGSIKTELGRCHEGPLQYIKGSQPYYFPE